uniref:Major facilitator superfamily (MFS) profile domain-containing protein n=1 Tax=Cuerna arida TaxID=1464854 RepID=A0A1B6F7M6_9HEMI
MINFPGFKGNLYACVLSANMASVAVGTHYSWPSPTLPKLQDPTNSWLLLTDEQGSWIGGMTALGTMFGPFLGGTLVNLVGRRWTLFIATVISIIAWAVVFLSSLVWEIYVGRFLGGLAGGMAFLTVPMYVAEVSEPEVRGALGSLFAFFLVGGFLIEYVFGPYVSFSALIYINFIPSILFFILFSIMPETPYYCLRKKNVSGALASLTWLRSGRSEEDVQNELTTMQSQVNKSMSEKATIMDLVTHRGNRRGMTISCGLFFVQQFSGLNVVLFYAQNIFIMAGTSFSSSVSTIIMGVILFVFRAFAAPLVRRFGMKNVLIWSAVGMTIFQFLLGLYFYLVSKGSNMSSYGWLPILSLVGYILCVTVGFAPIPWAIFAELFPSNVKALASSICASFAWFIAFILTKFFNNVTTDLGAHVAFFIFAFFSLLALLFTIFVVPDTRGMTLQDILDMLNS